MTDWSYAFDAPDAPQEAKGPEPMPFRAGQDPHHWLVAMRAHDPEQILACIFQGDPLRLVEHCPRVMREEALMIDPDRLLEGVLEEVAFRTSRAELGEIHLDWIDICIRDTCTRLIERDCLQMHEALLLEQDERYPEFIVRYFNVRDIYAKQASVQFNILPKATRIAFFEVYAERLPVFDYLMQRGETRAQLTTHIRNALQALGLLDPDGIPSSPTNNKKNSEGNQ